VDHNNNLMIWNCTTGIPWAAWAIVAVCWSVAIVYWVVAAFRGRRSSRPVAQRAGAGWIVAALAIALAVVLLPQQIWYPLRVCTTWVRWSGVVLLVGGTVLDVWARSVLGKMWSSTPVTRVEHELRTGGPYALVRHPMYTGLLSMLFGTGLMMGLGIWVPVLIADVIACVLKLRVEERLMIQQFGSAYREYQRRVPALVPWFYRSKVG